MRDPWSQNHNYGYSNIRKWFDSRLEVKTLESASAIVTLSEPWADAMSKLHNRKVEVITDGFDPDEVNEPPAPLTKDFTITYIGHVYENKQKLSYLTDALDNLGIKANVRIYQGHGRQAVIKKQRESQLLLLMDWEDNKGVYTTKVIEYLAARRPILATGGMAGSVVGKLLDHTVAGLHGYDKVRLEAILKYYHRMFLAHGFVPYSGDIKKVNEYTQVNTAAMVSNLLKRCVR